MKTLFLGAVLAILFGGFVHANAQTGETAKILIKNEKKLAKSKITIKFLELLEDSRCPTDVDCIWAGNARIKVEVRKAGRRAQIFELNSNLPAKSVTYAGYTIAFTKLTPQPHSAIRIDRNGYIAAFLVKR